ncbi:SRPBCC family protein [Nocardiopsis sp. MG754419]|uniref:SRPBCC family protein n=1 Tax=Nocardiopsis sp. MG754419 TaxID=2259865 RepID=UPI001BACE5A7|nr:SRPBCC family protein [Nocardiopsis sp. MG754419]MBR8744023.1 cyclase/dehydrase [Nocardiopsis sp. MG754419]
MSPSEEEGKGPLARLREAADRNEGTSLLADAVSGYLSAKARSVVSDTTSRLGHTVDRITGEGGTADDSGEGAEGSARSGGPIGRTLAAAGRGVKSGAQGVIGTLTGGAGDDGADPDGGGDTSGGSGGGGGAGGGNKATNIVEDIDVGVPVRVAYDQWSRLTDFADFTHRVESVEEGDDETTTRWRAKILWSTRSWKGIVTEQVPDQRIAWTSEGAHGTTKGVVTFHPLGENLTRILLITEYTPQGFFERTANLWRAQGRRLRLELKQYRRHLMMLSEEEALGIEGWRGEIRDGEVVLSHEDGLAEDEENAREEPYEEDEPGDEEGFEDDTEEDEER